MKSYTDINPVFSEHIQILETTTNSHADNVNTAPKQLLANTLCNKDAIEVLKTSTGNTPDSAYNAESVYSIGDYCIYKNELYKCIAAIEEAEAWNKDHWKKTTITKELLGLNNKEVEVVDPMAATEEGFAADAKLTGDAIQEVSANIRGTILWENPNPTIPFVKQDILLQSDDYDYYEVEHVSQTDHVVTGKIKKGDTTVLFFAGVSVDGIVNSARRVTPISELKFSVENTWVAGGNTNMFIDNNNCIPLRIKGYKL